MRTYHGRFDVPDEAPLWEYAAAFGGALRSLHAQRRAKRVSPKPQFMRDFNLTSRQFNAVKHTLDGMESSIVALRASREADLKQRLGAVVEKMRTVPAKHRRVRHQLARRRSRLALKLAALAREDAARICFGSRKLFDAQHHLAANNFTSHEQWRAAWRTARDSQFFVLGSHDETAGCQGCVMTHLGADRFSVRLRLVGKATRYLTFEVRLPYGSEQIVAALQAGQALSYRFKRDAKSWRVFVSTKAVPVPVVSEMRTGCVGVDLNVDHVAVSETDRFGNLIARRSIPLVTAGRSKHQARAAIGATVGQIIALACRAQKPVSIERLDFGKKKAQLSYASPGRQRMLSAFAYAQFATTLKARAHDAGIEVVEVNPAYSSKIGKQKYARRYGLSGHAAAALVLARRGQGFLDRYVPSVRKHSAATCKDRRGHVPARANGRAASRDARFEAYDRSPSGDPPPSHRDGGAMETLVVVGATPTRKSSPRRVRAKSIHLSMRE